MEAMYRYPNPVVPLHERVLDLLVVISSKLAASSASSSPVPAIADGHARGPEKSSPWHSSARACCVRDLVILKGCCSPCHTFMT